jgi:hypothetical protein
MNLPNTRLQELKDQINAIELSDQEVKDALFEGKLKKFNRERNRYYWERQKGAYEDDKGSTMGQSF